MKTAIIEFFEGQFNTESIMKMNNDERIAWANSLSEVDREYYEVNNNLDEFLYNLNCGPLSADWKVVSFQYSKVENGKFVLDKCDDVYNISARFCVTCKTGVYDGDTRINAAKSIRDYAFRQFGEHIKCQIWGYYNDDDDYRYNVYIIGDKCMILDNIRWFCQRIDDDVKITDGCELEWSMDGSDINQVTYECDDQCYYDSEHKEDELIEFIGECSYVSEPHHVVHDQEAVDEAIERANEELAECIGLLHNCKNLQEVYEVVDGHDTLAFGANNQSDQDFLDICYKHITFQVLTTSNGGIMIAGNHVEVFDDDDDVVYTGTLNEEGVKGVESQDACNIYLELDEPEQSTKDDESEENGIIDDAYYLESDDDEHCLYINDDFYLHVVVDAEYDQWSYALYDTSYRLLTKDWTCGIDMSTWESVLKNEITERVGKKIYSILPHSPKLFKHQKNA